MRYSQQRFLLCYARFGPDTSSVRVTRRTPFAASHRSVHWRVRSRTLADNIIEVRDIDFSRGSRRIFKDLSLTIPRGSVTAIMGPSGTGKTTLLQLITRQLNPDRGQVLVDGVDIAPLSQSELYALRRRFGVLFQNGALLTDLSVFENVAFPIREHTRLPDKLIRHIVLTKLHAVATLVVTRRHDVHDVATVADYSYVISDRTVAAAGTPEELRESSSELVRQFMNGEPDGPVHFHYDAPDYDEQLLGEAQG